MQEGDEDVLFVADLHFVISIVDVIDVVVVVIGHVVGVIEHRLRLRHTVDAVLRAPSAGRTAHSDR